MTDRRIGSLIPDQPDFRHLRGQPSNIFRSLSGSLPRIACRIYEVWYRVPALVLVICRRSDSAVRDVCLNAQPFRVLCRRWQKSYRFGMKDYLQLERVGGLAFQPLV